MPQANKHVLMATLSYNLKKLLKFSCLKANSVVKALKKAENPISSAFIFY